MNNAVICETCGHYTITASQEPKNLQEEVNQLRFERDLFKRAYISVNRPENHLQDRLNISKILKKYMS